jgi:cell division transport system permease protein
MTRGERFKRWLITLRRIIRSGCLNFVRNAWLSIAAMAVMLITLTIVLFSIIANATFSNTIQQITDKIDISVYLKDNIKNEQKDSLISDLKSQSNVKEVDYRSKEQAKEDFQKSNQGNTGLQQAIASLDDNPIPATIHIKPKDPNQIGSIKTFLESDKVKALQAKETSYSGQRQEAVDNITHATNFMRKAGVVGVLVFAVVSMLIIFNTIQMAIFNRRDELTIMRLLGASTWFIRGPFVVESILYGIFAAVISVVLLNGLFAVSSSTLQASSLGLLDINYANEYFANHFWLFLTLQLTIGIFIGAASSIIATRRYLKFKAIK